MNYNALAVCQKPNEKPFVVSVYTYFDKDVVISSLERFKRNYKNTEIKILSSWIEKVETQKLNNSPAHKEEFYKRICQNYINTMCAELLLENKENNNSILHAHIEDDAIDLKNEGKININNVKEYLFDEESIYEYETYEEFYELYVKDSIYCDIRDLGLFNCGNDEWDFYISYNDMILLGMEKIIEENIIEVLADDFETDKKEQQGQDI